MWSKYTSYHRGKEKDGVAFHITVEYHLRNKKKIGHILSCLSLWKQLLKLYMPFSIFLYRMGPGSPQMLLHHSKISALGNMSPTLLMIVTQTIMIPLYSLQGRKEWVEKLVLILVLTLPLRFDSHILSYVRTSLQNVFDDRHDSEFSQE